MSDNPTVQRTGRLIAQLTAHTDALSIYDIQRGENIAHALADAGLLADPTPTLTCTLEEREYLDEINRPATPEEQAEGAASWERFEAMRAVVQTAAEWRTGSAGPHPADVALRAAVDRLAATTGDET